MMRWSALLLKWFFIANAKSILQKMTATSIPIGLHEAQLCHSKSKEAWTFEKKQPLELRYFNSKFWSNDCSKFLLKNSITLKVSSSLLLSQESVVSRFQSETALHRYRIFGNSVSRFGHKKTCKNDVHKMRPSKVVRNLRVRA